MGAIFEGARVYVRICPHNTEKKSVKTILKCYEVTSKFPAL